MGTSTSVKPALVRIPPHSGSWQLLDHPVGGCEKGLGIAVAQQHYEPTFPERRTTMTIFERILIPLDGSTRAERILGQVGRILRREDSEIILLRVVDIPPGESDLDPDRRAKYEALLDREREAAEEYIDDLASRYRDRGASVHGRIAEGPAAETILKQSLEVGASMIALATHGRTGLARWVMGSVAEKVLRASTVPVLLVRSLRKLALGDREPGKVEELQVRTILFPTDGSPASLAALEAAKTMAQLFGSGIRVLHCDWPIILPGTDLGAMPILPPVPSDKDPLTAEAAERFVQAGLPVERLSVLGDPAGEILDQSQAPGIDLVVMATHGRSGLSRWALGSVAERVLRHADVPLVLVRVPAGKKMEPESQLRGNAEVLSRKP